MSHSDNTFFLFENNNKSASTKNGLRINLDKQDHDFKQLHKS